MQKFKNLYQYLRERVNNMQKLSRTLQKVTAWILALGIIFTTVQPLQVNADANPSSAATEETGSDDDGDASIHIQASEDNPSSLHVTVSNTKDIDQIARLHLWEFDKGFFENSEFTKVPAKDIGIAGMDSSNSILVNSATGDSLKLTFVQDSENNDYYLEFNIEADSENEFNIGFIGLGQKDFVVEAEIEGIGFSDAPVKLSLAKSDDMIMLMNDDASSDEWELGLVFYDSSVNNGTTPLTEINWDASDGSYKAGTPRVITVQINYRNTNAVTTYQPGEVKITIPNLVCNTNLIGGVQWTSSIIVGANDSTHTGYVWNFDTGHSPNVGQSAFTFSNASTIEETANFEGSIQIVYTITPAKEDFTNGFRIERYEDQCIHNYAVLLQAKMNCNDAEYTSNELPFNYTRTYEHPWTKPVFTLTKDATLPQNQDMIYDNCDNPGDYYWVQYTFFIDNYKPSVSYPNIKPDYFKFEDTFPEECIVLRYYDSEQLEKDGNRYSLLVDYNDLHEIKYSGMKFGKDGTSIVVGYPKDMYNGDNGNLVITNTADLYASYLDDKTKFVYQSTDDVLINLSNFEFDYRGELYAINKGFNNNASYECITDEDPLLDENAYSYISSSAKYTGSPMDIKIGDDLLYITDETGKYRKLDEDEYYFDKIIAPRLKKQVSSAQVEKNTYKLELWIKGNTEKILNSDIECVQYNRGYYGGTIYDTTKVESDGYVRIAIIGNDKLGHNDISEQTYWSFTEELGVTSYYFIIKDVSESINISNQYNYIKFTSVQNIAEEGIIYNFAYLQVYINDILQNPADIDSYVTEVNKNEIAAYDQTIYGTYVQRAAAHDDYARYQVSDPDYNFGSNKTMSAATQDVENELFTGTASLTMTIDADRTTFPWTPHEIATYIKDEDLIHGFEIYDLLPEGMELVSSEDQILDSLQIIDYDYYYYAYTSKGIKLTKDEFQKIVKSNTSIEIIENWNGTNRTYIHILINFKEPLVIHGAYKYNANMEDFLSYTYQWTVSYESFLEYGNVWSNTMYWNYYTRNFPNSARYYLSKDSDGNYVDDFVLQDLDMDNVDDWSYNDRYHRYETSKYSSSSASTTITSVVSTHQDVTTYVQTDHSNFSTGTEYSSPETDYTYRLRLRTGSNTPVENVVLITNLEQAFGGNDHWQGEFLGVDTSYIEGKIFQVYDPTNENADDNGYITEHIDVNVYYSEDTDETDLYEMETIYNDNAGHILTLEDGQYYYLSGTDKIYVDETEVVSSSKRKVDTSGNYIMNPNWKPLTDEVDKSSVKSLAFDLINRETGEGAIINGGDLAYVQIEMNAPVYEDGIKDSKVLYAYENYRTQWNPIDEFGNTVDYITGIQSNTVQVYIADSHEVTITKVDDLGAPLSGAVLQVLNDQKQVVDEWTTDGSAHLLNVINGTYTLHEVSSPTGFQIADDIKFTVDGENITIQMVDKRNAIDLRVYKMYQFTSGETTYSDGIDGAILQLWNSDKTELIAEKATQDGWITFDEVEAGEYILSEKVAPEHFLLADDIAFTLASDGTITTESAENVGSDNNGMYLKMKDEMENGTITIQKFENDGTTPLAGVTYTLYDAEAQIVDTKTTGEDGIVTFTDIPFGDYTIVETQTADGYSLLAEPISVTIPLVMSAEEAEDNNADTTQAFYDEATDSYIFFSLTYNVTDDATFVLPTTGSKNLAAMAVGGIGALVIFTGAWLTYRRKKGYKGILNS